MTSWGTMVMLQLCAFSSRKEQMIASKPTIFTIELELKYDTQTNSETRIFLLDIIHVLCS